MSTIHYVYPVVFYKDDMEEDRILAYFPDLDIATDGTSYEEAYLFAKDYLRVYFETVNKHDLDYNLPSKLDVIAKKYDNSLSMLVDTIVDVDKIKKN